MPPCGGAGERLAVGALDAEEAGLEERLHQRQDALVPEAPAHAVQQGRVVDRIEARRDVCVDHPLVRGGGQQVDLGDRVLGPSVGPEPVGARLEVRLPDGLEHQLQGRLHHPIPHRRDAQPTLLAARLGDQALPHGQGHEPARLEVGTQVGEERLLATPRADGADGFAVHAGGARTPVALDPVPSHKQGGRVADEVEQLHEPTTGIVVRPSVQLGLDPQYPRLRLGEAWPRRVGVHRRPPSLPVRLLLTRCPPSPGGRLSRPQTTPRAPPQP
jgi:hypothetical protein